MLPTTAPKSLLNPDSDAAPALPASTALVLDATEGGGSGAALWVGKKRKGFQELLPLMPPTHPLLYNGLPAVAAAAKGLKELDAAPTSLLPSGIVCK
jgi:hypothetical protein